MVHRIVPLLCVLIIMTTFGFPGKLALPIQANGILENQLFVALNLGTRR